MKVLVFGLFAALFFGSIFMAKRFFGYRRFSRRQHAWASPYGDHAAFEPFANQQSPFEQPLNPRWQKQPAAPAFGRRIEVL